MLTKAVRFGNVRGAGRCARFHHQCVIPALLTALWLGPVCTGVGAADDARRATASSGKLLITGSSTMAPVVAELAKRFQTLHAGAQIEVQAGGSGRGISDAAQGKADIGMASRALSDEESGLYSFAIARDGIGLVIHKDNPVRSLTKQQVVDIYSGKIVNWSKVGGRDMPITVTAAREGYSSTELFTHFFNLNYADIKAQRVFGDNPERIKAVADAPAAITYVSVGEAERKARAGAPIKLLPMEGVGATRKNIRSGDYPISRPLLLITKEAPAGLAKSFIDFSLSSQVTDLIEKYDFVPYLD